MPVPKDAIAETLVSYMGKTYDMSVVAALLPPFLLSAPWAFVLAEVASMMPRAIRGHKWYRDEFELYPPERKAVIPGVI